MPLIFLSDVHLRLDRPERGRRLARLVETLGRGDRLVVAGDLCDFWFASRQMTKTGPICEGLGALASFRERGGRLDLLPGNHDAWLGPFYQTVVGTGFEGSSLDVAMGGVRFRAVHGHRLGARSTWKGLMEARWFLRAFRALPDLVAGLMGSLLESRNSVHRGVTDRKYLAIYQEASSRFGADVDVCVFGHIHVTRDDQEGRPRMVVLGGWHHRSSYLRVEENGDAELVVVEDLARVS